jgi:hypothetical protein
MLKNADLWRTKEIDINFNEPLSVRDILHEFDIQDGLISSGCGALAESYDFNM